MVFESKTNISVHFIPKVLISITLLLVGIWINSHIVDNYMVSYINVLPLALCLVFLSKSIKLDKYVAKRYVRLYIIIICFLTLLCIYLSSTFLFADYLSGHSVEISPHWEHNWAHETIVYIADSLQEGNVDIADVLAKNYVNLQYVVTFFYSAILFIVGGDIVTNWCIWNGLHFAFIPILVLLISVKSGITDKRRISMIFIGSLIMPAFDVFYVYDRDIIGEFFLLLGFYIFVSSYKKSNKHCLYLFPLYAFFFFALRLQYVMIAVVLCASVFLSRLERSTYMLVIAISILLIFMFLLSTGLWTSLNFEGYVNIAMEGNRGIISTLLVGLLGYFPWTNLLTDENAIYHFFLCLQAVVDLVLWFYFFLAYRGKFMQCLYNPIAFGSIMLLLFGFVGGVGHIKYFCVSAPLFLVLVGNVSLKKLIRSYIVVIMGYIALSIVYNTLGFTGNGS